MKHIENLEQKQKISLEIKRLTREINSLIHDANGIGLAVIVKQNERIASLNSDVCVFISESIYY